MATTREAISDDDRRAFAEQVVRKLRDAGRIALFAGGCVRDLLLGKTPKDYDVATDAPPEAVRKLFPRTLAIGASFGVIQVRGEPGLEVEVATFRSDGPYQDGRRPESIEFATPEADAARRDFTINGMFFDPVARQVIDYVDGEADLKAGVVRAIGDPRARFEEDKLRLLRAVRFAARFDFEIDPASELAIQQMASGLLVVSAERILQELRLLLPPPYRRRSLALLDRVGLLGVVFPEVAAAGRLADLDLLFAAWPNEVSLPLALAGLLAFIPDDRAPRLAEDLCRRLRATNEEREACVWLCRHRSDFDGWGAAPTHFRKRLFAEPGIEDLLELARASGRADEVAAARAWRAGLTDADISPPPLLTGDDLRAAGYAPGPAFKLWLDRVRDAQLDGAIATPAEALALARRLAGS